MGGDDRIDLVLIVGQTLDHRGGVVVDRADALVAADVLSAFGDELAGTDLLGLGLEEQVHRAPPRLVSGSGLFHRSGVDAAEVAAVARIDLQLVAGVDEQRHLDLGAGLQRGGFGAAGGAVTLQTRVGLGDDELDGDREFDEQRGCPR